MNWKTLFFVLLFFIFLGGVAESIEVGVINMSYVNGYNVSAALLSLYFLKNE